MQQHPADGFRQQPHDPAPISRRSLMIGGLSAVALGLVGCGSNDGSGSTQQTTPRSGGSALATAPSVGRSGGVFRVGYVGGSGADAIDPILTSGTPDNIRMRQMYDTLTRVGPDGKFNTSLAEEMTQQDALTWTVRLKSGVTFHSGKTLDADDLIASIRRAFSPNSHWAGSLHMVEPKDLAKLDDLTVRIKLNTPAYYLNETFSFPAFSVTPADFDPKKPVGTGPFSLEDFAAGRLVSFKRNPDYFGGAAKVEGIEVYTYSDDTSRSNALLSKQIDSAPVLASSQVTTIQRDPTMNVVRYASGRFENLVLDTGAKEFSDYRVRQAMKLLINRDQFVTQVYGGKTVVANDIPEPTSIYYDHDIAQWQQNVDKAKSLLAEAGQSDMQLTLVTAPLSPTLVNACQVYTKQLTDAGLDVKLQQVDAGSFYGDSFGKRTFTCDIWGGWTFGTFVDASQLSTSGFHESNWDDQDFYSAFIAASKTTDENERRQHLDDAQTIMHDKSGTVIPAFIDVIDVYAPGVTGYVAADPLGTGGGDFNYTNITLA